MVALHATPGTLKHSRADASQLLWTRVTVEGTRWMVVHCRRLVFKAHRLVYHSTLGSKVIKKQKKTLTYSRFRV